MGIFSGILCSRSWRTRVEYIIHVSQHVFSVVEVFVNCIVDYDGVKNIPKTSFSIKY